MQYQILDWDTDFFGIKIAQIAQPYLSAPELSGILTELKRLCVELVYWPSDGRCEETAIKRLGGTLVDKKTTFAVDFGSLDLDKLIPSEIVEPYNSSMPLEDFESLAVQSGEYSRFHVDSRFPSEKFVALYKTWINRSLRKEIAAEVFVIRNIEKVAGMVTLGEKNGRGDIGLIAVDEKYRGRKYGEMFVRRAQRWFVSRGYRYGQVVTQGQNVSACDLYKKCGYSVERIDYFYHFWL